MKKARIQIRANGLPDGLPIRDNLAGADLQSVPKENNKSFSKTYLLLVNKNLLARITIQSRNAGCL
ncbi:MAG: hypothetical protein IPJ37_17765 [Bacteroidales bacterium]|nr:hypothetical protein [Bacteroidales bacterium]